VDLFLPLDNTGYLSRYVVGWMAAHREQDALAKQLIEQSSLKQNIQSEQLILQADRGPNMKSKTVANVLADLGVTKTHSRPQVSDDNPYSDWSLIFDCGCLILIYIFRTRTGQVSRTLKND
jgi:transposase InsO family protein